jgi:hypothetical protein
VQGVMRGMVLKEPNSDGATREIASIIHLPWTNKINRNLNHFYQRTTHKMPEGESKQDKHATQAQARQVIDVFHEISTLLVCTPSRLADSQETDS